MGGSLGAAALLLMLTGGPFGCRPRGGDDETASTADSTAPRPPPFELTILHVNDHHSHLGPAQLSFGTSGLSLAANIAPGTQSPLREQLVPSARLSVGDEQIGVVGITVSAQTKALSNPAPGTAFLDELSSAQQAIDALLEDGVDKIVLLSHQGYRTDLAMVPRLEGVDVVVGGHSHTLLGSVGLERLGSTPAGGYPARALNADGDPVCVVQAWEYARALGELTVTFDGGTVVDCEGQPWLPVDAGNLQFPYTDGSGQTELRPLPDDDVGVVEAALTDIPGVIVVEPDPGVASVLATFDDELASGLESEVATASEVLCREGFPGEGRSTQCDDAATFERGSDIADAVAKAFLTTTATADLALVHAGVATRDVAAGPLTFGDVFTLLPGGATLVTLELTGAQVVQAVEDGLAHRLDDGGSTLAYPYASGLRYQVDASREAGDRITSVEVNARLEGSWRAIEDDETYTVVTTDALARGGFGYRTLEVAFNAGNGLATYFEHAQRFVDHLRAASPLQRVPVAESSTQIYIGRDGCLHIPSNLSVCDSY